MLHTYKVASSYYSSCIACSKCDATYRADVIIGIILLVANAMLLTEPNELLIFRLHFHKWPCQKCYTFSVIFVFAYFLCTFISQINQFKYLDYMVTVQVLTT